LTNVSIAADKDYVDRFAIYARRRKIKMGTLVRQAIDAMYGDDLAKEERLSASIVAEAQSAPAQRKEAVRS
jgi:hypothetical protein